MDEGKCELRNANITIWDDGRIEEYKGGFDQLTIDKLESELKKSKASLGKLWDYVCVVRHFSFYLRDSPSPEYADNKVNAKSLAIGNKIPSPGHPCIVWRLAYQLHFNPTVLKSRKFGLSVTCRINT